MSYEFFSYENLIILVHLLAMLQFFCNDWLRQNLRHLDVVSAKTVFVLKTKATRSCSRESTQFRSDEIKYLFN